LSQEQKDAFQNLQYFFALALHISKIERASLEGLSEKHMVWVLSIINKETTHLNLSGTNLQNCHMLSRFKKLVQLSLDGCRELKSLEHLKDCPQLKTLSVEGCSQFIQDAAKALH
jgi:hypothetical protein